MGIKSLLRNYSFIGKPLLYLYHKRKNGHLVKFWYSTHLSPRCVFEGMNMVHPESSFYGKMGLGSYIGSYTHLNANVGRFTSIAPGVRCINGTHPMKKPFVTTCPLFYSTDNSKTPLNETFATQTLIEEFRQIDAENQIDVLIGNDCWIGPNVTLLGGISIADGAVVLANATVTKNVPPYAIVGGIPAKIIGYRYSEEEIKFILSTKWWNKNIDWFRENWELLTNFDEFKKYFQYQEHVEDSL